MNLAPVRKTIRHLENERTLLDSILDSLYRTIPRRRKRKSARKIKRVK